MISDVLSDMVEGLDRYLDDPSYDDTSSGLMRAYLINMRDDAEFIRFVLDVIHPQWPLAEAAIREQIVAERLENRARAERREVNQ